MTNIKLTVTMALALVAIGFIATTKAQTSEMLKDIPGLDYKSPKPKIMILGTFHFDNPGIDTVETKRDSISSDKRQKEVRELIDKIKAFKPTKIAIEIPYGNTTINDRYNLYLKNEFELRENEVYQIAFRLGKELNHKQLYPVDYKKDMDFQAIMKSAAANGQQKFIERFQKVMGFITRIQAETSKYSILVQFRLMNDLKSANRDHSLYLLLTEAGKGADYTGADVLAGWYERNLKIATNIMRTVDSPNEKVLVLIGSGHIKLLHDFLKEYPGLEVIETGKYLK